MSPVQYLDDPLLSAFIDGELDDDTCELIINEMDRNSDVRERVYQLRRAKDLVKLGFSQAKAPSTTSKKTNFEHYKRYFLVLVASISAVVIMIGTGTSGYYLGKQQSMQNLSSSEQQKASGKILLHISESNAEHFSAALIFAENFLQENKTKGAEVAIIANAGGLDFMRTGVSPVEKSITKLMNEYENIYFIACANSMRTLRKKGIEPLLIDNVRVEKPAMDHIIDYVQKGWTYKKVQSLSTI